MDATRVNIWQIAPSSVGEVISHAKENGKKEGRDYKKGQDLYSSASHVISVAVLSPNQVV